MKKLIQTSILAFWTGMCLAANYDAATVSEFTNAVAKAQTTGDTITLAAGVTLDFSTLESFSSGTSWGTMSAPDTSMGISCVWWQKEIVIQGADDTPWSEKTSSQETILDGGGNRIFYGYGGSGRKSTFKNLTFKNGTAPSGQNGGAIVFANSESRGGATNCVFKNCSAANGGATYAVPVTGSLFESCSAGTTGNGGGAYCDKNYCILSGNVFRGCSAKNGGAIYLSDLSASPAGYVANCVVSNCTASNYGGGMYSSKAYNVVNGCRFEGNASTAQGGACYNASASSCVFVCNESIENRGGAMSLGSAVDCAFTNNVCTKNGRGGACDKVAAVGCTFSGKGDVSCGSFTRCVFDGIVPDGNRLWVLDAISNNGSALGVTNCLVVNCAVGRIVNLAGQTADFANCTFADNTISNNGYTVYCDIFNSNSGVGSFVNCIFSGNKQADDTAADLKLWKSTSGTCSLQFSNCLYTDGFINSEKADVFSNPVHAPAKFVAGSDEYPGRPYYALVRQSAARNAGLYTSWMDSAVDLAGSARILEGAVDIGCYECLPPPPGLMIFVR
ncbi:MAG: hypothetical protein E7046_11760 [Lentisphaerae bacterium]|nr:hypothetical protein [Lentisphaerota bacterium]